MRQVGRVGVRAAQAIVGLVRRVGVRAARAEMWDRWDEGIMGRKNGRTKS
nr:hypothetical protein [Capnocytophaga sp.]